MRIEKHQPVAGALTIMESVVHYELHLGSVSVQLTESEAEQLFDELGALLFESGPTMEWSVLDLMELDEEFDEC